jgi:tetratricopeptide (TPR) repeat protein
MSGAGDLKVKKVLWLAVVFPCLLSMILGLQIEIDKTRPSESEPETFLLYLPSGRLLKPLTLGYHEMAADLLWIKTIDYFGGHYAGDKSYTWLYHMLDLVTTLDPRFVSPFNFGAVVLSMEAKQEENSEKFLEKAMRLHPTVWQFPFYMGFNLYFYKKDYKEASRYIGMAARLPGSPSYLSRFAAHVYVTAGDKSSGLILLREIYRNTKDEKMKKEILRKMQELVHGQPGNHTDQDRSSE